MMTRFLFLILMSALMWSCKQSASEQSADVERGNANPAAEGFNAEGSDSLAIAIADEVMQAMGGRQAWDNTRYISWTFISGRKLLWDKHAQRVRIDVPSQDLLLVTDLKTHEGFARSEGELITDSDSLASLMDMAESLWINDSYWLVMPFKLKDSGVTLRYVGEDVTQSGASADVLQLTFDQVGVTPQNKYRIWVGKESHLVEQWAFYGDASQPEPDFITPWDNYQPHGDILLSGDRGVRERNGESFPLMIRDISVLQEVPEAVFLAP